MTDLSASLNAFHVSDPLWLAAWGISLVMIAVLAQSLGRKRATDSKPNCSAPAQARLEVRDASLQQHHSPAADA
jgi:hypothetical protein